MKIEVSAYKLSIFLLIFTVINFENTFILSFTPLIFLVTSAVLGFTQSFRKMLQFNKVTISLLIFAVFSFLIKDCSTGLWKNLGLVQMPITLIICLITFLVIFNIPRRNENVDFLVNCFVYSTCFLCLIATLILRFNLLGGLHDEAKCNMLLSYGYNPNSICICTCFSALLVLENRNKKWYQNYLFLFLFVFSILTGSRKVIIIYGFYFLGYWALKVKNKVYIIGAVVAVFLAFIAIMKIPFLYNMLGSRFEVTFLSIQQVLAGLTPKETRMRMIVIGWNYFKESIWFGNGWASFAERYHIINQAAPVYSHCNFIEILCSSGIIGFLVYYSKFFKVFGYAAKLKSNPKAAKCFGMFLGLFFTDIAAVTYYYKTYYIIFAILLACLLKAETEYTMKIDTPHNAD